MWKALVAGGLALAIAGSTFVYAQQRPSDPAAEQARAAVPRFTAEDAQAFADARVAALKAGLKLTPEQEKNWPPAPERNDLPYGFKLSIDDGTGELVIFVNVQTDIDLSEFAVGQLVSVTGFSGQFDDHYEVLPRSPEDLLLLGP